MMIKALRPCSHTAAAASGLLAPTPCRHGVAHMAGLAGGPDGDDVFEVDANRIKYGVGALREVGSDATSTFGMKRVVLFTDRTVRDLPCFAAAHTSLVDAGADVVLYDNVLVEPTDRSFTDAIAFANDVQPDGFVSVGGGSVMDTCKAAQLYSGCPPPSGRLLEYVNAPVGDGAVPDVARHPLKPHIACPTTAGTGSEVTGIAIFDLLDAKAKTGIATRAIRPSLAVCDPMVTETMNPMITACTGFDVLSHAIESYTARPSSARPRPGPPYVRPLSQGSNPWADIGCMAAIRIIADNLERAVTDPTDTEARHQMMFAALLAGISFGNSGVHLPHAMSYSVAGLVGDFCPTGYPSPAGSPCAGHLQGLVPHGMSVVVNAPAAFRLTAHACPDKHLAAADALGADIRGAVGSDDAGEVLANRLVELMQICNIPNGLGGVGYSEADVPALVSGAWPQQRLIQNAPCAISEAELGRVFTGAISYW